MCTHTWSVMWSTVHQNITLWGEPFCRGHAFKVGRVNFCQVHLHLFSTCLLCSCAPVNAPPACTRTLLQLVHHWLATLHFGLNHSLVLISALAHQSMHHTSLPRYICLLCLSVSIPFPTHSSSLFTAASSTHNTMHNAHHRRTHLVPTGPHLASPYPASMSTRYGTYNKPPPAATTGVLIQVDWLQSVGRHLQHAKLHSGCCAQTAVAAKPTKAPYFSAHLTVPPPPPPRKHRSSKRRSSNRSNKCGLDCCSDLCCCCSGGRKHQAQPRRWVGVWVGVHSWDSTFGKCGGLEGGFV